MENTFSFIRKTEKMSKIMDVLLEKKWADARIAAFMQLVADQRKHATKYTVAYINTHKRFRENQKLVKAAKAAQTQPA